MTATPHWIEFRATSLSRTGEVRSGEHRIYLKRPVRLYSGTKEWDALVRRARIAIIPRIWVPRSTPHHHVPCEPYAWSKSCDQATQAPVSESRPMLKSPEGQIIAARIHADMTRVANLARDDHYLAAAKVLEVLARDVRAHGARLGQVELHNPPARKPAKLADLWAVFDVEVVDHIHAGRGEVKAFYQRHPLATLDDMLVRAGGATGAVLRAMSIKITPLGRSRRLEAIIEEVKGHGNNQHFARAAGMAYQAMVSERGR